MRAIILVGGFGTRLRPLTTSKPKQILPVGHKTMLENVVEHLSVNGITEVILSMGFQPDAFLDTYPTKICSGLPIKYVVEPEPLDTAGAIAFSALNSGIDETFLACNGDVITEIDLLELIDFHKTVSAETTISLTPVENPSQFGIVPTDTKGKVVGFIEKPSGLDFPTNLINAGYYVMEPEVLKRIEKNRPVSIETEIFPTMVADSALFAFPSNNYWIDAGTPENYLKANLDMLNGSRSERIAGIHEETSISPKAVVKESVVGKGVKIQEGAYIENSVVMEGALVENDSYIEGSIIGERAKIQKKSHVTELSIVSHEEILEKETHLQNSYLPRVLS